MPIEIILSVILRIAQAVTTSGTIAILAYVLQNPKHQGNDLGMKYTMFVSVFSLVYLLAIFCLSLYRSTFLIPGVLLVLELLITFFWICAIVSLGASLDGLKASVMCDPRVYNFETKVTTFISRPECHGGQAAFGLSVFLVILFICSSVWFSIGVVRIIKKTNSNCLWRTNGVTGCSLNKAWLVVLRKPTDDVNATKFEMDDIDQPTTREIL